MGNLDFLNSKSSNIVISTTVEELSELSNETANCLPSLSITTIYSKLGLTTTNVGNKLNVATNCAVRISSDVNFTPNANGKVYKDYIAEEQFVETVFNVVNFANGTVYAYTKGNISAADDPAPCIIIPKTFTDSESSAVFEKGVYLGAGIYSGGQTFYTKFEQKIDRTSIKISGKGFTSSQKPYSYISRSVKPDDDICVWINEARIPESIDEEFVKGFNAICNPNDFDSIAEIKLDENLANICKHAARQCLAIRAKNRGGTDYYYYRMDVFTSTDDAFIYYNVSYTTKGPDNNKVSGLYIEFANYPAYFNPNVTSDDYDKWYDKYIATEP